MAELDWNKEIWESKYDWKQSGEEWSKAWGSSSAQWVATILPRLNSFLPCKNILEIAPGYGRWTKFLLPNCDTYCGIDFSNKCIDACKQRFQKERCHFFSNDGKSLRAAFGRTYDLIFSFDSLVHVDMPVMDAYINQILNCNLLSDNGVSFIHHSNLKYASSNNIVDIKSFNHERDKTVDHIEVANAVQKYGGCVLSQEIMEWGGRPMIDCITVFTSKNSRFAAHVKGVFTNSQQDAEQLYASTIIANYIY